MLSRRNKQSSRVLEGRKQRPDVAGVAPGNQCPRSPKAPSARTITPLRDWATGRGADWVPATTLRPAKALCEQWRAAMLLRSSANDEHG